MIHDNLIELKYPIGKFADPGIPTSDQIKNYISEIEELPGLIEAEYEKIKNNSLFSLGLIEFLAISRVWNFKLGSKIQGLFSFK